MTMTMTRTVVDAVTELADLLSDALDPPGTASPGGELARVFASPSPTGADDRLILAVLVEVTRLLNLCTTTLATATEAAERAGIPARKRVKRASDLLRELGHPPAVAYRLARVGAAAASLPEVSRQARTGGVSLEHGDAVGRGVAFVSRRVPLDDQSRQDLARRLAVQVTPADVDTRARELALEWAPASDPTDPEVVPVAERPDLNEMTLTTGADGRTTATLDLDALSGEELHQALDPLCRPVPLPDGSRDPRTVTQRRAEAFGQIVRGYLTGRDRPTASGGVLPHVTLIVPTHTETTRTETARTQAAGPAPSPSAGASSVASLGFAGPVSPATVGLVVCEAAMRRVVLDGESAPLDVGREHRLVTVALRKALEARDRGCAFPGCGRPVSWTDAHHCVPWSDGGETSVDNCVLLCRMHHTVVHHTGWEVFIGHDRHPWFRPPADTSRPVVSREPIRSNARRTMTAAPTAAA
ncbi:HNH endonuclease signature motif containing protein [Gordonia aichiensis]|uniref:HNH endonuclease signature motif containing protein n=1 Tax=Gordonia aichiensis TaxID=36820 RepID=UPI003265B457